LCPVYFGLKRWETEMTGVSPEIFKYDDAINIAL